MSINGPEDLDEIREGEFLAEVADDGRWDHMIGFSSPEKAAEAFAETWAFQNFVHQGCPTGVTVNVLEKNGRRHQFVVGVVMRANARLVGVFG